MSAARSLLLLIAVVGVIGVGAYAPPVLGHRGSDSPPACTTCTTSTLTSSPTTATPTGGGSAWTPALSFSYAPSGPVKVDSVADAKSEVSGRDTVSFEVNYENAGSSDVYYVAGCGSNLVASPPVGSSVLQKTQDGPRCLCAEAVMPLAPGSNRTAFTPGCWSGYDFVLMHPGTVQVDLSIYWGPTQGRRGTNVTATFAFP